jgi:pimeloyl-ACP methyl ester carboxylesterase
VLTAIIENRACDDYDLGDRLRRIASPVLLLQGNSELGGALSDPEARWAASLIPDCALVTLPEIGHGIHAGEPLRFNALVTDFLESVPA